MVSKDKAKAATPAPAPAPPPSGVSPTVIVTSPTTAAPGASPTTQSPHANIPGLAEFSKQFHFSEDEIQRLYKRFLRLDKDGSGAIDREEFLSLPQIANNPLASRMIAIFDEDGGGDVDFKEFIKALSVFSSKGNKEEKLRFAFKVYDLNGDGFISNSELFVVLKMMVGNNLRDNQLQQIVDKTIMEADKDQDGKVSFQEFAKMVDGTDIAKGLTLETSQF